MITTIVATFGESFQFVLGQTFNSEETEKKERYCKIIDTFNVFYSAVSFGLFTVLFVLILPFMRLYTEGMDINYIIPFLPYLYLTIEVLTVGREAMMRTIEVAGHFKKTQWRALAEAIINLGVSIVAIFVCKHFWGDVGGLYGALFGTIVAMLYRTIDMNIYANRRILHRSSWHSFKVMLTNVALFIVVVLVSNFIKLQITTYLQFIIHGIIFTVPILIFFLAIQSLLNVKQSKMMLKYIKAGLFKKKAKKT